MPRRPRSCISRHVETTGIAKQKDFPEPVPDVTTVFFPESIDRIASLWCR